MKKSNRLISLFIFFGSLSLNAQKFTSDYIALTVPMHYRGEIWYINDSFVQEIKDIEDIKHNQKLLLSFPNTVSNVTVYELTAEGDLKFAGFGMSTKNKIYQVIYDFSQTQTISWGDTSVLVGVGVRMVAKIKTRKGGINLASPMSLAANIDKIDGSLEVRVTGISSRKINELIPTTTDLSPASISAALQAVATIKSHIYDSETIITPQYLAYNNLDEAAKKSKDKMNSQDKKSQK